MTAPRIVILDQDRAHCAQCCDLLRAAGFEPVIVLDPSEVAAVAERERAVAALLEAEADPSGASVFEALRRQGIPCFGMSTVWLGGTNRALGIGWDGCAEFWEKPVPPNELRMWLKRLFPDIHPAPVDASLRAGAPKSDPAPAEREAVPMLNGSVSSAVLGDTFRRGDSAASPSTPQPESQWHERSPGGAARLRESGMVTPLPPSFAAPSSAEPSSSVTPAAGTVGVSASLHVPLHLNVHRVAGSGNFSETAFATILARLAYDRSTGALMMQRDEDKRVAYLQDGFIVGVKTNMPEDSLADMLVAQGLMTFDQGRRAQTEAQRRQVQLSDVLVELGFFAREDMQTLVSTHIRNHLMDVFAWESGVFMFRDGPVPRGYDHEPVVSPMDFIWQGVQFNLPLDYAESAFAASMQLRMGWFGEPPSADDMPMTLTQLQFLSSVSAGETLGELQRSGRMKEPVWRIAYVLASTGFLGFQR